MPAKIKEVDYIRRINSIDGIEFSSWVGKFHGSHSRVAVSCDAGHRWEARLNSLVNDGNGCPHCAGTAKVSEQDRISRIPDGINFIEWVEPFKNAKSKMLVECSNGHRFTTSSLYLRCATPCPKCRDLNKISSDDFIERLPDGVNFIRWDGCIENSRGRMVVMCNIGHQWSASVSNLTSLSSGCPRCSKSGYDQSKVGFLYALRSGCGRYIKIGITNKPQRRHRELRKATPFAFDVIEVFEFADGSEAMKEEARILSSNKSARMMGFQGATEWLMATNELFAMIENLKN